MESQAESDAPGDAVNRAVSAEERKAALERAVFQSTREFRGFVQSQSDFEALIVHRHEAVNHRRHLLVVVVLAVVAGLGATLSAPVFPVDLVVPLAYAVFWLGLTLTRGEELETLSVDERGQIESERCGRSLDLRGDLLRVGIPAIVVVIGGLASAWLIYNVAFPPLPQCPYGELAYVPPHRPVNDNEICQLIYGSLGGSGGVLTVGQVKALNRTLQGYYLAFSLVVFLAAAWVLWRMLTGRFVLGIRPVRRRDSGVG